LLHIPAYHVIMLHIEQEICVMQLMSIEDLSVYLGDSKRTIYKYIASGDCPPYIRISAKNIKFDRADVDAWLESKKINPKERKKR
jgi:excisionase family DNA binding protein